MGGVEVVIVGYPIAFLGGLFVGAWMGALWVIRRQG